MKLLKRIESLWRVDSVFACHTLSDTNYNKLSGKVEQYVDSKDWHGKPRFSFSITGKQYGNQYSVMITGYIKKT